MESRVDLDQVAALITRHAFAGEESGLVVGALTWRDAAASWPFPLREDRGQVVEPDSVGVAVRKHGQEGQLVVFRGGWADLAGERADSREFVEPVSGFEPLTVRLQGQSR